jgi:hypothetical protein
MERTSQNLRNPRGAVRRWPFGPDAAGHVVYLVLGGQREVHLPLLTAPHAIPALTVPGTDQMNEMEPMRS